MLSEKFASYECTHENLNKQEGVHGPKGAQGPQGPSGKRGPPGQQVLRAAQTQLNDNCRPSFHLIKAFIPLTKSTR